TEDRVGPGDALRPQRRRGPAVHPPRVPQGLGAGLSPGPGARVAPSDASFSGWPGSCPRPDYARDAVQSTEGGTLSEGEPCLFDTGPAGVSRITPSGPFRLAGARSTAPVVENLAPREPHLLEGRASSGAFAGSRPA